MPDMFDVESEKKKKILTCVTAQLTPPVCSICTVFEFLLFLFLSCNQIPLSHTAEYGFDWFLVFFWKQQGR